MAIDRTGDYVGGNASGGSGRPSGGDFEIDLDRVPGLIDGLQQISDNIRALNQQIRKLAAVPPPGGDPFSDYASRIFGQAADGGSGGLYEQHLKYLESLEGTIENYKAILQGAQAQEQESANSFGGQQ